MSKAGVSAALKDLDRVAKKQRTSYPRTAELLDDLVSAAPRPLAPRPRPRGARGRRRSPPRLESEDGNPARPSPSGPRFRPGSATGRSASAHRRALKFAPAAPPRRVA